MTLENFKTDLENHNRAMIVPLSVKRCYLFVSICAKSGLSSEEILIHQFSKNIVLSY